MKQALDSEIPGTESLNGKFGYEWSCCGEAEKIF